MSYTKVPHIPSVEDSKPETYLPNERYWSGYILFSFNQNQVRNIFIILTYFNQNIKLQQIFHSISSYSINILDAFSSKVFKTHIAVHYLNASHSSCTHLKTYVVRFIK